jgi:hypothetical protein
MPFGTAGAASGSAAAAAGAAAAAILAAKTFQKGDEGDKIDQGEPLIKYMDVEIYSHLSIDITGYVDVTGFFCFSTSTILSIDNNIHQ